MATLKERIDSDLKDSMRKRTELKTSVLRMLKSAIMYKEVEPGGQPLDDDELVGSSPAGVEQAPEEGLTHASTADDLQSRHGPNPSGARPDPHRTFHGPPLDPTLTSRRPPPRRA